MFTRVSLIILSVFFVFSSGCGGSSCRGITATPNPEYAYIGADWASNTEEAEQKVRIQAPLDGEQLIQSGEGYSPSELAIVLQGSVSRGPGVILTKSKRLTFSLFELAYACSLSPPTMGNEIQSVDVSILSSNTLIADDTSVTNLFSVKSSQKRSDLLQRLEDWNTNRLYRHENLIGISDGDSVSSLMLIFESPEEIESGTYTFSLKATLEDGTVFMMETDAITVVN